jgi:hypothetical protein
LLADRHLLRIDGRATSGPATLTLTTSSGQAVALGPVTVVDLPRVTAIPAVPYGANVSFGNVIRLLGYAIDPLPVHPGTQLRLTLYWQATGLPDTDETVFVHLLDGTGKLVAQADAPPGGTAQPTSTWEPGQVVTDVHTLTVPATLAGGVYHLQLGLYNLQSGTRLAAAGPGLPGDADHADLAQNVLIQP